MSWPPILHSQIRNAYDLGRWLNDVSKFFIAQYMVRESTCDLSQLKKFSIVAKMVTYPATGIAELTRFGNSECLGAGWVFAMLERTRAR